MIVLQKKSTAPPSLMDMDTRPANTGMKLESTDNRPESDRKLPKALEDVLALKDIRAKQVSGCAVF